MNRLIRMVCLAVLLTTAGEVQAGVLSLNYSTASVGGGLYRYDFTLILSNQSGTYVSGQNFNVIIFGDALNATSPIADFVPISSSFPNPDMVYATTSGEHNGPTYIDFVDVLNGGWIPTGVNDFVTWSGTSQNNVTSGLLFSNLRGTGERANFDNANFVVSAVPEPASMVVWGIGTLGMGLVVRRRKKKHTATA